MITIGKSSRYLISVLCLFFIIYLCAFPSEMLGSAKAGLLLWYNSVLPSVLPFLIITNVLIAIGAVSKLGRILEPVMRPLFNVPGCGAFALIMGGISGYPVGAKITADFREKELITKDEAQRLVAFCNNPGPLFMLGAVGASILGSTAAGYLIMAANYFSAITLGLLFRFYKSHSCEKFGGEVRKNHIKYTAPKAFGAVLADSVRGSIEVAVLVGGFIVLFSALMEILRISGYFLLMTKLLFPLFSLCGIDQQLIPPFVGGIFEITNGIKMAGETSAPFMQKVILSGALVSFGGLSICAQAISFTSKTDISSGIYIFSKLVQAAIQFLFMLAMYPIFVRLK